MSNDYDQKSANKNKLQIESDDEEQVVTPLSSLVFENKLAEKNNISQFFLYYMKEMSLGNKPNFQYEPPQLSHKTINRLNQLNISYHPHLYKYINITIQQCTPQCTVMEILVELGFFTLKIIILNKLEMIIQNSPKSNIESFLQINGCFGKILYRFWDKGTIDQNNFLSKYQRFSQYFVQKIFYFEKLSTTENGVEFCYKKIHTTILQYCFGKIAYGLEIGPKIQLGFGFDIVCYKNGILFFMERCRTLRNNDYSDLKTVEQDLKHALILFHSLKIIHNDIKFDNIMFSERLNKIVFIDFGLSELVKQKLGKKTQSLFKGSYYFVSDQMKSLIVKNNGYVDLYWNDLHCLKKSFQFLQGNSQQRDFYQFHNSQSMEFDEFQSGDAYNMPQSSSSKRSFQFHQSRELAEGNSMIPSKQQEAISNFNHAEAELLQYQIFYLLYKKNIQLFRTCLSAQNKISQSLRVYIMNLVMQFLQEMQGCPIYDEIYHENYFNYKYNIEYQNLKYSQQHEQATSQILSVSIIKNSSYQKISKRYLKLNTKNELINHYIQNAWIAVFDEISEKIYHLTSFKTDSFLTKNNIDFTQYLQHFANQKKQVQESLCNILVYALSIPITQQKEIRRITKKMIMLFKSAALTLIYEGFIEEKLNIPKTTDPRELTLRKQLVDHIEQITQTNKDLLLIPGNIQNQLQTMSYMLVNRIIEKYIFKQEFIKIIEEKKINLFINSKKIHSSIQNPSTKQKIKILLFMNYCDHYDYKNAYRILEEIQSTFSEQYRIQAQFYCLAVYLKMFIQSINFRCGYELLTRLKSLAIIFKRDINSKPHPGQIYPKRTAKITGIYDFQSNEDYIDYYIKYLQLQILVNKGLGDYNARQLQQMVLSLQQQSDDFYLFHGDKGLRFHVQSQFMIIKMMIYDLVHRFQQNLQLGKRLYNYYTRGMNDRQVGSKLLFRSNYYLGVEPKRMNTSKCRPYVQDREVNQIEEFKKYSVNFEKLLKKEKLQIKFFNNYGKFKTFQQSQCISDFDEIITVIKSIQSDIKIFTSQQTLRINSMMTLFVVIFNLQMDFLYQKITNELRVLVDRQIKISLQTDFNLETMMILNDIIEDLIGLIFQERKLLPKDVLQYFWTNYRDCVFLVFKDRKQTYPTSFWIMKIIVEHNYYEIDPDINLRYKTQLTILQTLDRESDFENGFRHLNFVVQFFIRLSYYQMNLKPTILQSIQENQKYLLDILKRTVQTIVGTNRRYLLLFYFKFTQSCIRIFYENQYFHSIFFLFQVMASFVKMFPGQKNMDTFCQISNLLEKLQISKQFVHTISEIVADKMIQKELQAQFPQIVTFFIILCTKIIALNFNSVLKSEWFLKKMTFQFQRLPRYMKKKFLPKYLNMFGQFYERKENKKKSFQMKMKFLRVLKLEDSVQQKWKKYKNCVYFLEQKLKLKSRLNDQNYIEKMVALKFHLKLRKLYFASLITQPQPPINRLQRMGDL